MPNSKPSGAVFFRSHPVLKLTRGPTNGGSSSSGGEKSSLLQPGECFAATTFFFLQEPWWGEWLLCTVRVLFPPQEAEAARCSLADIPCKGGGTHQSTIMQSGAGASEA